MTEKSWFHRTFVPLTFIAVGCISSIDSANAQQSNESLAPIEQQMTTAERQATGLEKLNADELRALNQWLQRSVQQQTAKAVEKELEKVREEGRQEVIVKNRGFFDFGSKEPIESILVGEFTGFANGKRYVLENGQEWEQTEPASLAGVKRTNPAIKITPGALGVWYMQIPGYNTRAKVRRTK